MKFTYAHRGHAYTVELLPAGDGFNAIVDGKGFRVSGDQSLVARQGSTVWVHFAGRTYTLQRVAGALRGEAAMGAERILRAPMPGQVIKVFFGEGDTVRAGDVLAVLEAMKMEIRITAPRDGKLARIAVSEGQRVDREQILVELDGDQQ